MCALLTNDIGFSASKRYPIKIVVNILPHIEVGGIKPKDILSDGVHCIYKVIFGKQENRVSCIQEHPLYKLCKTTT